jgi:acetyl-CoA carboxylase biotin carboxyl carrier protein
MQEDSEQDMGNSPAGDVFDVKKIRRLIELMKEYELTEIDLRDGGVRVRLSKGSTTPYVVESRGFAPSAPAATAPAAANAAPAAAAAAADPGVVIKSPMVGTFYVSSSPETPPFVKVGDHVGSETTVCIIEAMKVFNEIPAEMTGKITAILVENGSPVEYGQPLFKVDPKG